MQPHTVLAALERIQAQLNELRAVVFEQWPSFEEYKTPRGTERGAERVNFTQQDPRP